MVELEGFLLAGGLSSRMGSDKAALSLGGVTFVKRVARALGPVVSSVRLVGRADAFGLEGLPDLRPGSQGPLAGIETALASARARAAIVVACDMPFVTSELFALLAGEWRGAPESIVVPVDAEGRLAPLCAVYPRAALAAATELLDAGKRAPRDLFARFPVARVEFASLAGLRRADRLLANVNTPAEFARLSSLQ